MVLTLAYFVTALGLLTRFTVKSSIFFSSQVYRCRVIDKL